MFLSRYLKGWIWLLLIFHQTLGNALRIQNRIYYLEDFGGIPDSQFFGNNVSSIYNVGLNEYKQIHPSEENNIDKNELKNLCLRNTKAFNLALETVKPGDTIKIRDGEGYTLIGGVYGEYLHNITIDFAGYLYFWYDMDIWPYDHFDDKFFPPDRYVPAIFITKSQYLTLTSTSNKRPKIIYNTNEQRIQLINNETNLGGMIDGNGRPWWEACYLKKLPDPGCSDRPRLLHISKTTNVLVENITLINSPYWTFTIETIDAEIRYVNVLVDRNYQRSLPKYLQQSKTTERKLNQKFNNLRTNYHLSDDALQPLNLNTDGIDVIGLNIWIHDCMVLNDDDSICIKPATKNTTIHSFTTDKDNKHIMKYDCTQNITVENAILTGFGATIGSVGPKHLHNCVDNVIFRNVTMPKTGKGIYIKSNANDCKHNVTAQITHILYDNIQIIEPLLWAIWIGPQAQHQPHTTADGLCPLIYPLHIPKYKHSQTCPTQGCVTFENITLKNIIITDPLLSPGVILGNETNPMKSLIFDNVQVINKNIYNGRFPFHENQWPYNGIVKCDHSFLTCKGGGNICPICS